MAKLPNKFIPQRGSKRPYIDQDLGYRDTMDRRPAKEDPDYQFRRQSEFKKPYRAKDYPSMEYNFDYPGIGYDWPYINGGGDITPGLIDDINKGLWNANFYCSASPCHCEHYEKCFDAGCTWKIVGVKIIDGQITVSGTNRICIKGTEGYKGTAEIRIIQAFGPGELTGGRVIYGSQYVNVPFCGENECCSEGDVSMAWDDGASADTITQGNTATVAVTGNNSPFDWSVSGTGFSMASATTEGVGNTLIAASDACGVAFITVTGCDGNTASGMVRCTDSGQWVVESTVDNGCFAAQDCNAGCAKTPSGTFECDDPVDAETQHAYDFHWVACGNGAWNPPCTGCVCTDMGFPPCTSASGGNCHAWKYDVEKWEC